MLIKQANQSSVISVTIGSFLHKSFKYQLSVCNGRHDLLMMLMNLSDIAILKIESANYCCIISRISINEAIIVMQNAN